MKKSRNIYYLIAFVLLLGLTSCNRGVGCPYEFSVSWMDALTNLLPF